MTLKGSYRRSKVHFCTWYRHVNLGLSYAKRMKRRFDHAHFRFDRVSRRASQLCRLWTDFGDLERVSTVSLSPTLSTSTLPPTGNYVDSDSAHATINHSLLVKHRCCTAITDKNSNELPLKSLMYPHINTCNHEY